MPLVSKPSDPFPIPIRPGALELKAITLGHALGVSLQLIAKDGTIEVNPQNIKAIDNYMQAALTRLDDFSAHRVALHAARAGDIALAQCEAPNEITRCLAVAYAIIRCVELQYIDADSTLAVTALAIVMEAELPEDEVWSKAQRPKYFADQILSVVDRELRGF